jgi:XTP/dITP diphosphohydrolase
MTTKHPAEIVLASNNPGKLREIDQLLATAGIRVRRQDDFGIGAAEETGLTFVENAILKARHASKGSGRAAIADDSGIEVDALDGAPGIYSARYAGPGADDQANNEKLLAELADVPEAERTARYRCLMVYLRHALDPTPVICLGTWNGYILRAPRGKNGFGYDPLFFVSSQGCTAAELDPDTKNRLSHRGQALRALVAAMTEPQATQPD